MNLVIEKINSNDITKKQMSLLLLADPSEEAINSYLHKGECLVLRKENKTVGIMVLTFTRPETMEISNLAVQEEERGNGYGKKLVNYAVARAKKTNYKVLEVGTGNSSIMQLALYQKCGFRITAIDKDFFLRNYSENIYENGIQCCDMLRLSKYI